MRLFIAIDVSKEVHGYLLELQKSFSNLGSFKFTKTFHITLKFLGWVEDEKMQLLNNLLKGIKYNSFGITLNNIGVFPSPGSARILWIDITGNIKCLQEQIQSKLKKDFGSEERFHPHITLARIKKINNKELFKEKLINMKIKNLKFKVKSFKLVKSELRTTGPVYIDIKEYRLK